MTVLRGAAGRVWDQRTEVSMAEQGKKVEVRFGAFQCSIEGYDNPTEQMREILGMMQRMIAETPQLAEADPGFDADRIGDALSEGDTATPGIVVNSC